MRMMILMTARAVASTGRVARCCNSLLLLMMIVNDNDFDDDGDDANHVRNIIK